MIDDLSATLAAAAFGDAPGTWPLPAAVTPRQRWLRAVAAGGQGRYGSALAELAALYRQPPASEEQLLLLGPLLWKEKHPLLIKKWLQELAARERILERVRAGRTEEAARRAAQLEEEIAQWRRLWKWLCEENP